MNPQIPISYGSVMRTDEKESEDDDEEGKEWANILLCYYTIFCRGGSLRGGHLMLFV